MFMFPRLPVHSDALYKSIWIETKGTDMAVEKEKIRQPFSATNVLYVFHLTCVLKGQEGSKQCLAVMLLLKVCVQMVFSSRIDERKHEEAVKSVNSHLQL